MKTTRILNIIFFLTTIGSIYCQPSCQAFNNRWNKKLRKHCPQTSTCKTDGVQDAILMIPTQGYRLVTVLCNSATIDKDVVRCLTQNSRDNIAVLTLEKCNFYNVDLGNFLTSSVSTVKFEYKHAQQKNLNFDVIFSDKVNIMNVYVTGYMGDKLQIRITNETRSTELLSIENHGLKNIGGDHNWTLFTKLHTINIQNGPLINFSPIMPKHLKNLNLDNNKLTNPWPKVINNLDELETLNISFNKFISLEDTTIAYKLPMLKLLDISHNQLKVLSDGAFNLNRLAELNLSSNPTIILSKTNPFGNSTKLKKVSVVDCNLTQLPNIHGKKEEKLTMDFSNNQMSNITLPLYSDSNKVIHLQHSNISIIHLYSNKVINSFDNPVSYFLQNNQLVCNCSLQPFLKFIQQPNSSIIFSDINLVSCKSGESVKHIDVNSIYCPGKGCPPLCTCNKNLNCTNKKLTVAPSSIPWNTTEVHLENNEIRSLSNTDPTYWNTVIRLYISNNFLTSLDKWNIPLALKTLFIDNNHLTKLPSTVMEKVSSLPDFKISLAGNRWQCNCEMIPFKHWFTNEMIKIVDVDQAYCTLSRMNTSFQVLIRDTPLDKFCEFPSHTGLVIGLVLLAIFLLATAAYIYRFRRIILALLYSRNLIPSFFMKPVQTDKEYDALVLYNEADREIVDELIQRLEPLSRLFIPGRDSIKDEETESNLNLWVQKSRLTLLIMTKNSLQAKNFQEQCRIAYKHKKKEKIRTMIPIFAGDINDVLGILLDTDIRHIIVSHPNMIWGERWFWQKLRLALRREEAPKHKWQKVRLAWQREESENSES